MNRRQAISLIATLCGGAVFGAPRLLAGVANALEGSRPFSAADLELLNEIGETIIPVTPDSGGAKAANIAAFMQEIVRDFYSSDERATFEKGLGQIQSDSRAKFSGRAFLQLKPAERHALLLGYEKPNAIPDFYQMLKQLTLWGYFTSEVGAKQALAYLPVPGRYQGCLTVAADTKPWAE
jgi:hypothetical protein